MCHYVEKKKRDSPTVGGRKKRGKSPTTQATISVLWVGKAVLAKKKESRRSVFPLENEALYVRLLDTRVDVWM